MRRRILLSTLGLGVLTAVAVDWVRETGPPEGMCVDDPGGFYDDAGDEFVRIGGNSSVAFAGAGSSITHAATVPADPVDELPALPADVDLETGWETRVITGAAQAHWPADRAGAWAAFEAARALLDALAELQVGELDVAIRAGTNPDGITHRTDLPSDRAVDDDAVGLVQLSYPVRCIESPATGRTRVFAPDFAFPDLVAMTPEMVEVDVTMGEHRVAGPVPTAVTWNQSGGVAGSPQPVE